MIRALSGGLVALLVVALLAGCGAGGSFYAVDPLPSWRQGAARDAIVDFVGRITDPQGPEYLPASERLAVFDNDGTLIVELPSAFQFEFIFERVRVLARDRPEWATTEPFQAAIENDFEALRRMNYIKRRELGVATSANMTEDEFDEVAQAFIAAAKHPKFLVPWTELVYQPMLELIFFLQENDFSVFIVSGGGIEFIRAYSEETYGIPRQNVIGSSRKLDLREQDGRLVVYRQSGTASINGAKYKPLNIQLHTGMRPVLAVGNSDGDLEMLQYTADNQKPSLVLLVQHDDAGREYAYDEDSVRARRAASEQGWQIVSMRDDFRQIFPGSDSP